MEPAGFFTFVGAVAYGNDLEAGVGKAVFAEAEFFSSAGSDIEDPARDKGSTIVNSDFQGLAIFEVCDLDEAGEGESFVSSGEVPGHDLLAE